MVAAGGCLVCHAGKIGVIGAFIPASRGAPIMYVICPACWASYPRRSCPISPSSS